MARTRSVRRAFFGAVIVTVAVTFSGCADFLWGGGQGGANDPPLVTGAALNIAATSAALEVYASPGLSNIRYRYRPVVGRRSTECPIVDADATSSGWVTVNTTPSATTATQRPIASISGLTPDTTYEYCPVAYTGFGSVQGMTSEDRSGAAPKASVRIFYTPAATPSPTPSATTTASPTPTATPTVIAPATPTATAAPAPAPPVETTTATPAPTAVATPEPTPPPTPSPTPAPSPTATATPAPTATATTAPTPQPVEDEPQMEDSWSM